MNALYLLRHSLTDANERHLYGGSTDLPLTPSGRQLCAVLRAERPLPEAGLYISSGMRRADETLLLLTGRAPDQTMPGLREMRFGEFEMRGYEELKRVPAYVRWIEDQTGLVACPGGECFAGFKARVLSAGETLLRLPADTAIVLCHGGVIVQLMQAWFPSIQRHFYEWQPTACRGYRVEVNDGKPSGFDAI